MGIFELLVIDDHLRRLITAHTSAADIASAAVASGMTTLRDDGVRKIRTGMTTTDEVARVTARATGDRAFAD